LKQRFLSRKSYIWHNPVKTAPGATDAKDLLPIGVRRQEEADATGSFLAVIEAMTPWAALLAELEPFFPKSGKGGRPPLRLERMLRMYVAQQCFGL